jgi:hypothetical protein
LFAYEWVMYMFAKYLVFCFSLVVFYQITNISNACSFNCGSSYVIQQKDPDGPAVKYGNSYFTVEIPEKERPNDATISLYEDGRRQFFSTLKGGGNMYSIKPKGNSETFKVSKNPQSAILDKQLSKGYILSYLYYDNGTIKYNGIPKPGRFKRDIDDKTLFFTHSTGKSIISYIVGHAICEGYISSVNEPVNWPVMSKTLYSEQPLIDLLNMSAGDKHTVNQRASRVMGSKTHHRNMDHITIAKLLQGTERKGNNLFYNNVLTDIVASYVAFRTDNDYDKLLKTIFQDKIRIENEVHFELHRNTSSISKKLYGKPQIRASYSFMITRGDLLRVAISMMRDYQQKTCVGNYLRDIQQQAKSWPKYRPSKKNASLYLHNYARKYGGQFYFKFHQMEDRNIMATEGYNGQNIMIDMDNSKIVVTQSAATAWDQKTFILNVIRHGKLPK